MGGANGDVPGTGSLLTSLPRNPSASTQEIWAASFKSKGLHKSTDPFIEASVGSFSHSNSVDPATKEWSYAANAYYHPVKDRENLAVLVVTGALVEKIPFDRQSPQKIKANAVQYRHNGELKTVTTNMEVI